MLCRSQLQLSRIQRFIMSIELHSCKRMPPQPFLNRYVVFVSSIRAFVCFRIGWYSEMYLSYSLVWWIFILQVQEKVSGDITSIKTEQVSDSFSVKLSCGTVECFWIAPVTNWLSDFYNDHLFFCLQCYNIALSVPLSAEKWQALQWLLKETYEPDNLQLSSNLSSETGVGLCTESALV